jgi:hypothetical protein
MKKYIILFQCLDFLLLFGLSGNCLSTSNYTIAPRHKVTLRKSHVDNLEIDIKLLDSYELSVNNIRQFYRDARSVFSRTPDAYFTNDKIMEEHILPYNKLTPM